MKKKLFSTYFIIILVTLFISGTAFWNNEHSFVEDMGQDLYLTQAKMLVDVFDNTEFDEKVTYETFAKSYGDEYSIRITLISMDGTVVADSQSDPATMANHASREEVKAAIAGKAMSVQRYSSTLKMDYSYSAVPVTDDEFEGVLRVSVPLDDIKTLDSNLFKTILFSLMIASGVAIVIAIYFSRYLTKPIDEITQVAEKITDGNYDMKIYTRQHDQIGKLAESFNHMTGTLKENMQSLTGKNAELEAILRSMASGVVAVNDSNAVLFHNETFSKMVDLGNRDIIRSSLYSFMRSALIFDVIDDVRETRDTIVREGRLDIRKEKAVRVTGTPLFENEGRMLGVLVVIEDITEMKKLENMRSDFVSNVTHELKTPLTSIRGFVDTLKTGAIHDEKVAMKFLNIIDIEAERLYSLIQDILLLSEIESKKDNNRELCDITPIMNEVVELLAPKAGDETKLIYREETPLRPFYCNHNRIKELMINLVDNAINYTEKGSVTITCKEKDDKLIIDVTDTGIGMEEEYLERIFERFYRVDKGRSRKQGGTGLGLSIVKHIVENYHGTIAVRSKVGVGTSMTVELPYKEKAVHSL